MILLSSIRVNIKPLLLLSMLWLATIISSLTVVYVKYETRLKYNQLEVLQRQKNHLQVVWGQYLLEESTWAAYNRVEQIAKDDLDMQVPAANHIVVVDL